MKRFCLLMAVFLLSPSLGLAGRASCFHDFAQVGDGGGIRTLILITTQNSAEAIVQIRLIKPDGSGLQVDLGAETNSSFQVRIPPGGTIQLATAGDSDPPQRSWARVISSEVVGAQVLFEIRAENQLVTQAAVESSGALRTAVVFVSQDAQGSRSGVAIANLADAGSTRVQLTLKNEAGETVATRSLNLPLLGQEAKFISELFDDIETFCGTLCIKVSSRITTVALQQTGLVLGSLPPVF